MLYELISLDADDTGDINDMWATGDTLDLPENPNIQEICNALKEIHRMAPDWPLGKVGVDWEDDGEIYLRNETGRKIYLLRPKNGG